jgi:membrane fusion protein (multidrug efflux system)
MTRCFHICLTSLLLVAGFTWTGCKKPGDKKEDKAAPIPVQVLKVAPSSIARVLEYDADVKGLLEVNVFSQVPERIVAMKVKEGDRVRKGQVMAQVRADTLSALVNSASAALDAARADRSYLKSELTRQNSLLQRKIVSAAAVDQLKSRLASAEAGLRRLQATARQASTARGNAVIRAPIEGIVGRCNLNQGDLALPTMPICTVVQMDQVELILEVPERDLARIKRGMTARIKVARFPDQAFEGKVVRILPTIDRRTRTAQVKVQLNNAKHRLMPGMLARVNLEVERRDNVVVVPYSSLIIEMGAAGKATHRAYVVTAGSKVEQRTLTLGIVDGKRIEITSGIAAGEQMVTRGQHLLEPGGAARVVERLTSAGEVIKVASPTPKQDKEPQPADKSGKEGGKPKPGKGS